MPLPIPEKAHGDVGVDSLPDVTSLATIEIYQGATGENHGLERALVGPPHVVGNPERIEH
jgi:hypothetical protein